MLFSTIDTRSKADAGVPMHLRHPITNAPLFDNEQPVCVIVRSLQGREAQEIFRNIQRVAREWEKETPEGMEDHQRHWVAQALPLITGFINLEIDEGKPATVADAARFLDLSFLRFPGADDPNQGTSFAQQVLGFLKVADAELGNASAV